MREETEQATESAQAYGTANKLKALGNTPATKGSPIISAQVQLEKSQAVLQEEIFMLVDAIKSVLTPVESGEADGGQPDVPKSDLTDFIERAGRKAFNMASFVRGIRERVEL